MLLTLAFVNVRCACETRRGGGGGGKGGRGARIESLSCENINNNFSTQGNWGRVR